MTYISLLLYIKIIISTFAVVLPFLFAKKERLEIAMQVSVQSLFLFRLYGIAIFALLVGYAGGIWQVGMGQFPWGVIFMGIVSNAGAVIMMVITGSVLRNKLMFCFFGLVAAGLVFSATYPEQVMKSIF